MAAGSLLLLLDDIASALDDVALMTKVAAYKTAAVLGDDLALNAQQLHGLAADRELRVVWAVAKGSLRNKFVLVPTAILLSSFAPALVLPLLVIGGWYLCYEGAEKLAHRWMAPPERAPLDRPSEQDRIAGAVRTDFILSAEIIVIALGTVSDVPLGTRISVLAAVGLLMTFGVYGLVGAIVKLDDLGLYLSRVRPHEAMTAPVRVVGRLLIDAAPWLMRLLSVAGTAAMFLVGGGILVHAAPALHGRIDLIAGSTLLSSVPHAVSNLAAQTAVNGATGLVAGALALVTALLLRSLKRWRRR